MIRLLKPHFGLNNYADKGTILLRSCPDLLLTPYFSATSNASQENVQAKSLHSTLRCHVLQTVSGERRRRSTRKARRTACEEREGRVWRTPPSLGGGGGWETGSSRRSREHRPRRDRQSRRPSRARPPARKGWTRELFGKLPTRIPTSDCAKRRGPIVSRGRGHCEPFAWPRTRQGDKRPNSSVRLLRTPGLPMCPSCCW